MQRNSFFTILFFLLAFQLVPKVIYSQQELEEWEVCKECHSIGEGKIVGPDLKGITEEKSEEWLIDFIRSSQTMIKNGDEEAIKIFNEYYKVPMPDNDLTDEQIKNLLTYIKNYQPPPKELIEASEKRISEDFFTQENKYLRKDSRLLFFLMLFIFLLFLIDIAITKFIKWKWIHAVVIFATLVFMIKITYTEAKALGYQKGYSPDQPILFSHKIHSTQNQIDCIYCHSFASDGKYAGIPSTELCMNCHSVIKEGANTGKTEINKIFESRKSQKPIEWIRVYNMPDHVYFNHATHVNLGKMDCTECHGNVEDMDRIVQVKDLSMGWCIDCHREKNVEFKKNDFYKNYKTFHQQIKSGQRNSVSVEDIGGLDCSVCHY